ncbi:MAG: NYN domain-containing protein [Anaerolineae bacterium]
MPFLIDGHNVIAALPDIDLEDPDDEAKLVVKLRAWSGRERRKAIVIFDGGIPGGPSRVLSSPEVRVVFAARHHSTADRIIKERLSALPDAPNWTVVSSDREVLDNARATGAKTLSAQEFAERLTQTLEVEKEKPEGVPAAEVEAWLEVFETPAVPEAPPTSEAVPAPQPASPAPHVVSKKQAQRAKQHALEQATPPIPPSRTARSIAEQVGVSLPPPPKPEKPTAYAGKPAEVSPEEVESWLQVFHDAPESNVPPPKSRPSAPPRQPKQPVVKKHGALSEEEVETWLEIFGGEPEPAAPPPVSASEKPGKRQPAGDPSKPSQARLIKRKRQLVPTKDEEPGSLSKEDEELWFRLYGRGDR